MVPEGWSESTLGKLLDFKNGFNTDKSNYGHGTPFINVSEVLKNASLKAEQIPGMVNVSEKEASANAVVRGDILFNRTSETTDEVGFTSVYLDDVPVVFGGFVIRGRPINGDIHPEYGQYAMRQPMVRYEIIRRSQGAVRSNIGQGELSKVRVHLPPLPEQRKIADILSTWDQAIEKTEALLANARTQKRALMQQLLTGKRRFPAFEGQPWKEVRLGDVSTSWSGGTPSRKKPEFYGGNIPWIKSGEVNASRVNVTSETITEIALKQSSARMVKRGNILVAMYGATAGVVSIAGIDAAINQAILAVDPQEGIENSFLHRSIEFAMETTKRLTQGGQPNLAAAIIRATKIFLPEADEQRLIATAIEDSQNQIEGVFEQVAQLRTEKKALMQQLLTGKRRVAV